MSLNMVLWLLGVALGGFLGVVLTCIVVALRERGPQVRDDE